MFARTRPPGEWNDLTAISGAEAEDFDAKIVQAIDGTGGGEYDPTAPIVIGGSGLEVNGDGLTVSGGEFNVTDGVTSVFDGNVVVEGDLGFQVTHLSDLVGDVTMHADASVGGVLAVTGDAQLGAGLFVTGLSAFQGIAGFNSVVNMNHQVNCGDELNVAGDASFAGDVNVTGTFTVDGQSQFVGQAVVNDELVLMGAGRIRNRVTLSVISGLGGGQSITAGYGDSDVILVGGGGVLSGIITWRLRSAGVEGAIMHVSRVLDSTEFAVYVVNDVDGSMIINLDGINFDSAILVSVSGTWKVLHRFIHTG